MTQSYRVFDKKLLVLHPPTRNPGPFSKSVRPTKWSRTRDLHYLDAHHAHGQRHAGNRRRCMTKSEDTVRRTGWPRGTQAPRGKPSRATSVPWSVCALFPFHRRRGHRAPHVACSNGRHGSVVLAPESSHRRGRLAPCVMASRLISARALSACCLTSTISAWSCAFS